ncbi:MAG TPA: alanine dehydrogenase [Bacteroidales bacterium]|nr:alanine dehydrogenase [Bacteroidales bacterium]
MKIGCVKEIKHHEYRVGLTPSCVKSYVSRGNEVKIESGAGASAGFTDEEYVKAGAVISFNKKEIFDWSEMIVKVKEPLAEEYDLFHEGQILYTYLHLAASKPCTDALLRKKVKGVAYETIQTEDGQLPCLKPMSEIAGRLSIQEGAKYLEKTFGGRGVLLGGVPGVKRGKVAIIGGGMVGLNACKIAAGIGADVTILDINANRLAYLDDIFGSRITALYSTDANIEMVLRESDLVIGAVLLPGAKAPNLIKRAHLPMMKPGAVIVDVAVDQGGCAETTKPTTHDDPVFIVDGVVHYCVANMPGVVALSSTQALTSTTLNYGLKIAELGLEEACRLNNDIKLGVNTYDGNIVYPNVAKAFNLPYVEFEKLMGK